MLYKIEYPKPQPDFLLNATSSERHPRAIVPEIVIPRQGEQSLVVIISYLGYSPPKCTCHGKQSHSSNYMNLLECLHDQSHVPSPHRLPHICLSRMRVKISNFQNKSFLFSKTHYRISVKILDYPPRRIAR